MKPVQIVLLVIAGALGGALVRSTWVKPKAKPAVSAAVQQTTPQQPAPVVDPGPAPAPSPARSEPEPADARVKPSPVASHRATPKPRRRAKPAPPPANPRPVETARVEPTLAPRPEPAPAATPAPESVAANPPARSEPEHETPPPPNRVTLNAGVLIPVRLVDGLSSERNLAGDVFTGTLDHELVVDGFVIAERGARVDGRVVDVDRGGKVKGLSTMTLELARLHTSDGQTIPVQTDAFERRGEPTHNRDAAKIGGGAAIGAIIGAIAGGGKGAAIGAGVGGGAGAGDVLLTRGKPVTFPSETRINFRLRTPVTVTERR